MMKPMQQIGLLVAGFSVLCLYFGIVWSFDNGLLMLGNLALLLSFALILGPWSVFDLFISGARGVLPFLLGIALVFYNFRFIGMCVEVYGACLLVMAALPHWLVQISKVRFIGWIIPMVFPSAFNKKHNDSSPTARRRSRRGHGQTEISDSEDDANSSPTREANGRRLSPRQPRLGLHGTQVDGTWVDIKSEYDADQEVEARAQLTSGKRPPKLSAIGRRNTVY